MRLKQGQGVGEQPEKKRRWYWFVLGEERMKGQQPDSSDGDVLGWGSLGVKLPLTQLFSPSLRVKQISVHTEPTAPTGIAKYFPATTLPAKTHQSWSPGTSVLTMMRSDSDCPTEGLSPETCRFL